MYRDAAQRQVHQLAAELFTDRHDYLLAIARRNAHTEVDAEEALQEAFASFIAKFDPTRGAPPLAWLTLTLKRHCWRARREAHLDRHYGQQAESGGEELGSFLDRLSSLEAGPAERLIERDEGRRRLRRLKPDERSALGLRAAGLSYAEIGERKGWTYTKVNRCLAEGRTALRRQAAPRPQRMAPPTCGQS
jgi:RNA polymerase sigma factor (sigma-70 family)